MRCLAVLRVDVLQTYGLKYAGILKDLNLLAIVSISAEPGHTTPPDAFRSRFQPRLRGGFLLVGPTARRGDRLAYRSQFSSLELIWEISIIQFTKFYKVIKLFLQYIDNFCEQREAVFRRHLQANQIKIEFMDWDKGASSMDRRKFIKMGFPIGTT